ncbi:hypothetical protein [Hymenobacter volaticus]|uniref:Outer membrane protein beta-barrel domain-containing protein n=1 Tax=Hymenobacter volaticus TaxID=2932254 RepID=A0ABY4GFB8_9BACT|nr:hypothetical protein [Hymenobacter volaticus]UOQ69039.1 hypothetical protein MUN86_26410 [Hymenobacter volaticus]
MKKTWTGLTMCFLLLASGWAHCQNVLEGSGGKSSIDYSQYGGGILSLNSADKKIQLAYINYKYTTTRTTEGLTTHYAVNPYWYGLTVSGKALNSFSTIFSNGKVQPSADIRLKYGYRLVDGGTNELVAKTTADMTKLAQEAQDPQTSNVRKKEITRMLDGLVTDLKAPFELWLIGRGGYAVNKFNRYDASLPFTEQFYAKRFDGLTAEVGLNYWHPNILQKKLILLAGVTLGMTKQDNFSELREVIVEDVTTITTTPTPSTTATRIIKKDNIGFAGNYLRRTAIPVNIDVYLKPHKLNNAAFSLYGRMNSYYNRDASLDKTGRVNPLNVGVGFYLLNDNWLANPVGGLTVELADTFQTLTSEQFKDRLTFNVLARVNIFKYRE